ncbi:MAG: rhomboid family intramembrane serine protease [Verrucomicrobiae bacterium]|nr:rhomboid family intramembrane serine protease [Verrucomicrobiae bacterium]
MGIYDRDYTRDEDSYGLGGSQRRKASGPGSWSVVTWLIVINVAVHLAEVLILDHGRIGTASRAEVFSGEVYLLLTYQFVHADFFHLLFNMLVLFFWGYQVQRMIGTWSFLGLYFGAGLFGGLAQILYSPSPILGASAAVVGVVFGLITLMPRQVVNLLLFFVIPIRTAMWKIGAVIVAIELTMMLAQDVFGMTFAGNGIANVAHLGGAFFGWFWIAWVMPWQRDRDAGQAKTKRWTQRFGTKRVVDAEVVKAGEAKPKEPKPFVSAEIDAILDKISQHGIHSLTDEEKKFLEKQSKKLSRRVDGKG